MRRSSSSVPWAAEPPFTPARRPGTRGSSPPRGARLDLATIPPGDDPSETDVQTAEAERHEEVAPGRRAEQRNRPEDHEAEPHERHHPHRERAAGHHAGAVEQEPGARKRLVQAGPHQSEGEQRADRY